MHFRRAVIEEASDSENVICPLVLPINTYRARILTKMNMNHSMLDRSGKVIFFATALQTMPAQRSNLAAAAAKSSY